MDKTEIFESVKSKIDELPTLPVVIPKILNLLDSSESSVSDLKDVIIKDPALTSKILKTANSAYYGFASEISELDRAITVLGFKKVKTLALSIGIIYSMASNKRASVFSREKLWLHSLSTATLMKEMALRYKDESAGDYLFVAGLLHDTGKIVMDQHFSDLFDQILQRYQEQQNIEFHLHEKKIMGCDHGELGGFLLSQWNFPEVIINPISVHHNNFIPDDMDAKDVSIIKIANGISKLIDVQSGEASLGPNLNDEIDILGIDEKEIDSLKFFLSEADEDIKAFYSVVKT